MVEICKYRLPCGRCDKFDTHCDLTYESIDFIVKDKLAEDNGTVFVVIETIKNNSIEHDYIASIHFNEKTALYKKAIEENNAKEYKLNKTFRIEQWAVWDRFH